MGRERIESALLSVESERGTRRAPRPHPRRVQPNLGNAPRSARGAARDRSVEQARYGPKLVPVGPMLHRSQNASRPVPSEYGVAS